MKRDEPILQTYARAEGLLGPRKRPDPVICNLNKEKFEPATDTPQTTVDSSGDPLASPEPKPKKHVRFAEPAQTTAEFYKPSLDKKEQPIPQEVIDKIKAVYFTKET